MFGSRGGPRGWVGAHRFLFVFLRLPFESSQGVSPRLDGGGHDFDGREFGGRGCLLLFFSLQLFGDVQARDLSVLIEGEP